MEIIKNGIMLGDCMDLLKELPDKSIDLCLSDPPYGINHSIKAGKQSGQQYGKAMAKKSNYKVSDWDKSIPNKEYFDEIKRVSKNIILWGGNYFSSYLENSSGWIFWDKNNGANNFSDGELAYTSFKVGLRKIKITWHGMLQENMKEKEKRFHECQKPVALYRWILQKYAKPGQLILDTHSGSGSLACACHLEKFDFIAIEKDPHYHALSVKRLEELRSQGVLF